MPVPILGVLHDSYKITIVPAGILPHCRFARLVADLKTVLNDSYMIATLKKNEVAAKLCKNSPILNMSRHSSCLTLNGIQHKNNANALSGRLFAVVCDVFE
jgi:hypothetical protein